MIRTGGSSWQNQRPCDCRTAIGDGGGRLRACRHSLSGGSFSAGAPSARESPLRSAARVTSPAGA
jgi:hypothetical protein